MSEAVEQIFNEIKHGDEKHQAWLLETLRTSPTLAALQRRVEWTKDVPMVPGQYWWRNLDIPGSEEVADIMVNDGKIISHNFWLGRIEVEYNERYEWAGPIPPPHEARG